MPQSDSLRPYRPAVTPLLPGWDKQNAAKELQRVSDALQNVKEVVTKVEAAATGVYLRILNNLSDLNNVATARTNLGLGSAALHALTDFLQPGNNLSDLVSAATARTNLGLGSAALQASSAFLQPANNLSDVANAATARSNLVAATKTQTDFIAGVISTPKAKDYRIIEKIPVNATITGFTAKLSAGTLTAALTINTTPITGGSLGVTTTQGSTAPSANNAMIANNTLILTLSSISAAADLSFVVSFTRVLD